MSFTYAVRRSDNFVMVKFEGTITPDEENQAIVVVLSDPDVEPAPRILADRRDAVMMVGPEHVAPSIEMVQEQLQRLGKPRIAVVVARDYDFGMLRMFELRSEPILEHDFVVTRDWGQACEFLGVDPHDLPEVSASRTP